MFLDQSRASRNTNARGFGAEKEGPLDVIRGNPGRYAQPRVWGSIRNTLTAVEAAVAAVALVAPCGPPQIAQLAPPVGSTVARGKKGGKPVLPLLGHPVSMSPYCLASPARFGHVWSQLARFEHFVRHPHSV